MTSATLTRAVTELSAVLRRPVALNDKNMIPVASTPHEGPIDASRLELLYGRPAPESVRHRLFAEELGSRNGGPRHIAAFHGLDLGRAYVPVRDDDGDVVGHVWVIDPEQTVSLQRLRELSRVATTLLAGPLHDSNRSGPADDTATVVAQSPAYRAVVITRSVPAVIDPHGSHPARFDSTVLGSNPLRRFGVRAATMPTDGRDVVGALVLGGHVASLSRERTTTILDTIVDRLTHSRPTRLYSGGLRIAVSPLRAPDEPVRSAVSALKDLLSQAVSINSPDGPLFADELDSFEFLTELRHAFGDTAPLRPLASVEPLLATARTREVARTVKAYLESNEDATQTAQKLFIHRGTLYYRINQAQRLTGLSMSGAGRLRLHLGLVLADLAGRI